MTDSILIVPGISNSGPNHWQSLWEQRDPAMVRVAFAEWDAPRREEWVETLEATVRELGPSTIIVAHSLGCLALAHWAVRPGRAPARAALMVCVPDPQGPNFPEEAEGFAPLPLTPFGLPALIVQSSDDPYGNPALTRRCAAAWGCRVVDVGARGHVNADSGVGAWEEGLELLQTLRSTQAA